MTLTGRAALLAGLWILALSGGSAQAQGPPIFTDTPIMLGLEGRGLRLFLQRTDVVQRRSGDSTGSPNTSTASYRLVAGLPLQLWSPRWQVGGIVPLVLQPGSVGLPTTSGAGIGDVQAYFKVLLLQRDRRNETLRLAGRFTAKLPTGDRDARPVRGTGTTDLGASATGAWIRRRIGIYLESGFLRRGTHQGERPGHQLHVNAALGYRLVPDIYETYPSPQLNAYLEAGLQVTGRSRRSGDLLGDAGSQVLWMASGLQYIAGRRWLVEAAWQWPVWRHNPNQIMEAERNLRLGIRLLLY